MALTELTQENMVSENIKKALSNFNMKLKLREKVISCKKCGCTNNDACVNEFGEACYWVKIDDDQNNGICSHCYQKN